MASNKIAKRIEELKARVVEASNSHNRYRDDMRIPQPCAGVDPLVLALNEDTSTLVGTERARDQILRWLMEGGQQLQQLRRPCFEPWTFGRFLQECYYYFIQKFCKIAVKFTPSRKTKVISIVGLGGVGKTALAHQVYTTVKSKFDCTAFVSASQNPNMIKIFSDILSGVGCSETSSLMDVGKLIDLLKEHLKDKRYLIMIDDVWTKDAWKIFKCCFVENNRGSRVIITTQIEDVAKAWCPCFDGHVYRIKPLDDLDSRRLFHTRIFGFKDACPKHLKTVSNEILKKCGGLPLAILSVAGILAAHDEEVNSKETWEKIKNYLGFQLERNPAFGSMRHVLDLGYNDLSLDLKTCMLYLGIFPEDSEIVKGDLVKRWIAEGFVTDKFGYGSKEIVAENYFNELIKRNMIQVARMDDCGHVLSCRVHDVMLEFIMLKATEENFVTVINDLHSTSGSLKVRRLSLHVRNSEFNNHALGDMGLTQVRSLNFWGPPECMPSLSKFELVRVIHLDVHDSKDELCHMSSICKFFMLRFLRIRGVGCRGLLRQLCNLQNLQTLEILPGKKMALEIDAGELPSTLWHLDVPSSVKLFGGIGRMKDLRTLGDLDIHHPKGTKKSINGLGELANLRELKVSLSQSSSSQAHDVVGDLLLSSLCRLSSLQSLIIHGSFPVTEDALALWHPPPRHLRRLHALVCPFSIVPTDWITHLDSLRSLEIKVVSVPMGGADVLARLTSLVHLRLHVDKHVPKEGLIVHRGAFPHLKEFWFAYQVPCLMFEAGAMPKLQSLTVRCFARAKWESNGVLDGIEHLGSLKACRVDIVDYQYELQAAYAGHELEEDVPRWDRQALAAAFRKAISKHTASLDTRICYVHSGVCLGPTNYYTF